MKENIFFTGAVGTLTIDMTSPTSRLNFGQNFTVLAFNATAGSETTIEGFSITKTFYGRFCTQLFLDGINGDGYIILENKDVDCCQELVVNNFITP